MPEVVLEVIALVLQRIEESFSIRHRARPPRANSQALRRLMCKSVIHVKCFSRFPSASYSLYSRKSTRKSGFDSFNGTPYTREHLGCNVLFLPRQFRRAPAATRSLHLLEQKRMVPGFYAQNEVHLVVYQVPKVRAVAGQAVLDDDELQVRMLLTNLRQKPLRRIPLAVVLAGAIPVFNPRR